MFMKSLKKVLATFLLSTTLLTGVCVSTTAFAYSANVEKKLEKIEKNIAKQNEKLQKQEQKRSNRNNSSSSSNSGSSSSKTEKIREKISDLQEEASDIKEKEDAKIAKVVKSIESRKTQSNNKIATLTKSKATKSEAAKKKYENDVKARKATDPTYVAPAFKFNSNSIDKQIADEKAKLVDYDADIAKARGTNVNKKVKKNK